MFALQLSRTGQDSSGEYANAAAALIRAKRRRILRVLEHEGGRAPLPHMYDVCKKQPKCVDLRAVAFEDSDREGVGNFKMTIEDPDVLYPIAPKLLPPATQLNRIQFHFESKHHSSEPLYDMCGGARCSMG